MSTEKNQQAPDWQQILIEECYAVVKQLNCLMFADNPMPKPYIKFSLKGRCAGQAHYQAWELRFNDTMLQRYQRQFIEETVTHEVAHLAVMHQVGGVSKYRRLSKQKRPRPHGREWRCIMAILGADAKVTHSFAAPTARKQRGLAAKCDCGTVKMIGPIQGKRLQQGERRYFCRLCISPITLI